LRTLNGRQLEHARDALVSGYGTWDRLNQLAAIALDIDLELEVGRVGGLKQIAWELLKLTESSGTTEMLLREAAERKRGNSRLAQLTRELGLAPAAFSNVVSKLTSRATQTLALDAAEGYEAIVRPRDGTAKAGEWRRIMAERERAVCQILFNGDPIGTGFLVGPAVIMSNHHVFELPDSGGGLGPLGKYSARFDYRASAENAVASLGFDVQFDPAAGYLDSSPKIELDYVLLALARPVGDEPAPNNAKRGWLTLDNDRFEVNDPVFILQHPRGRTLELAVGVIVGWEEARKNEVYDHVANTEEGSSGSPCFSWQWALRALHHRVDPVSGKVNRAISTAAILERMAAVGSIGRLPPL
jgi:hypothetical protein